MKGTEEMKKVVFASFALREDVESFVYYLMIRNNNMNSTWDIFKHALIQKYEDSAMRGDLLQDKLKALRYHESLRMTKFCERFRFIEIQIYDMTFLDRVSNFIEKLYLSKVAMHIKNADFLHHEDIKMIYQLAR